jgi:GNAT superfamily N-acetyltransferase
MSPVTLRLANFEDIPDLAQLMKRSVLGLAPGHYSPEQTEWAATYLTVPDPMLIGDSTFAIIEIQGVPAACGGWSRRRKLFTGSSDQEAKQDWLDPATESAKIRAFFVDPNFARRGLARQLFDWSVQQARAHGFSGLELMATLPGVPLYLALGFEAGEAVEIDLPNGRSLPCLRMSKALELS